MAIEKLWVVCDRCGKPTPSGVSADPTEAQKPNWIFRNNMTQCPNPSCKGHMILWSKAEIWPESQIKGS